MLSFVLHNKTKCYSKEKHKELPEIMCPFFSCGMSMCMYFHKNLFQVIFFLKCLYQFNRFMFQLFIMVHYRSVSALGEVKTGANFIYHNRISSKQRWVACWFMNNKRITGIYHLFKNSCVE